MELSLKKTALAVVALGASSVASAAMYPAPAPACTPGNVTVPCERSAWDLGIEAILVEPTSGPNWNYAESERTNAGGTLFAHTRHNYDPGYIWGWRLEGSYHFGTGSDVTINWIHFDEDNSARLDDTINDNLVTPYIDADDTSGATTILGRVDTKHDAVNFEFGQHADYGQNYNVRFHYGFQWARVDVDNDVDLFDNAAQSQYLYNNDSKFDGFGVRGGIDTSYDFGNGFSIEGKGALGVLVGDLKSTATFVDVTGADPVFHTWDHKHRAIVPEVEGLVDLRYTHGMANGDFSIYLGWRFVNYFDAVQTTFETNNSTAAAGELTEVRTHNNNFGYHGPMLGIKWVGNA